jgi:DNA-binding transcriptional LysR family regulator
VHGVPTSIADLATHNCLSAGAQDVWQLEGPEGPLQIRPNGNVRSDSGDFIHQALRAGVGIGLRSTWSLGNALKNGDLKVVLPQYRGSSSIGIYAVYPCRDYMPAKVSAFIDFLAEFYAPEPYWEKGLDLSELGRLLPKPPGAAPGKAAAVS